MATTTPCCLDCLWCVPQAEPFGATSYRCERRKVTVYSAVVLDRSCDRFERKSR